MNKREINIPRTVYFLLLLAVILNFARIFIFHSTGHIYILWNIFLATLPFLVSLLMLSYFKAGTLTKQVFAIGSIVWILLLPNAPYIVTDLIHIGQGITVPEIFDSFVLFSSALVGLVMGMYSMAHMEEIFTSKYGINRSSVVMTAVILLSSVGIYLGRFLRWNSWDVFTNPLSIYTDVREVVSYQANHSETLMYIGLFFVFIYFSYKAWKNLGK